MDRGESTGYKCGIGGNNHKADRLRPWGFYSFPRLHAWNFKQALRLHL